MKIVRTTKDTFLKRISVVLVNIAFIVIGIATISCQTNATQEYMYAYPNFSDLQRENIIRMANDSILIQYRSNFVDWEGRSLLILAILAHEDDLVPQLLSNSVNVNIQDNAGNTALMYAIAGEKERVVEQLLAADANMDLQNFEGMTALMFAALYNRDAEIISLLLDRNANKDLEDKAGNTAWDFFQENSYLQKSSVSPRLASTPEQNMIEILKQPNLKDAQFAEYGGVGIDFKYKRNSNALMWAAKYNKMPKKIIPNIAEQVSIYDKDDRENTALFYAINNIYSDSSKVGAFNSLVSLNPGPEFSVQNIFGETPLIAALRTDAPVSLTKQLIDKYESLNDAFNTKFSLLVAGEYTTNKSIHNLLIKNNGEINAIDGEGQTPLHKLARGINKDNPAYYSLYKKNDADVTISDINGNNPLQVAARGVSKAAVITALSKGDNTNSSVVMLHANNDGKNAMHIAAQYNSSFPVIKKLRSIGGDLIVETLDINNVPPVFYAAKYNTNKKIIQYLLRAYKTAVNIVDSYERNVLMYAAQNQVNADAVDTVLKFIDENDINKPDLNGNTALHYAAEFTTFVDVIRTLVENGAVVNNQNDSGQTPLMLAMLNTETPDVAEELLKLGADPNLVDNEGQSAIVYAAKYTMFIEHIRSLNARQASTAFVDSEGRDVGTILQDNRFIQPYLLIDESIINN